MPAAIMQRVIVDEETKENLKEKNRPAEMRRQRKFPDEPLIGTRIKMLAVGRGFSLRELAAATGLKYYRIRNIVYGYVDAIHSHELRLINAALCGNYDWIVDGRGDPLHPSPTRLPRAVPDNPAYDYIRDPNHPLTRRLDEIERRLETERRGRRHH